MPKPKKITLLILVVLIAAIVAAAFFYERVQRDHWTEMTAAAGAATKQANLTEVSRVEPSVGDEAYHVVFGKDAEGKAVVVWVSANETHVEKADGAFTEEQARAALAQRSPAANVMRALPNKVQGEYVWELFYKMANDQGETKYYYDYYKFTDGTYLDTYRLSL